MFSISGTLIRCILGQKKVKSKIVKIKKKNIHYHLAYINAINAQEMEDMSLHALQFENLIHFTRKFLRVN